MTLYIATTLITLAFACWLAWAVKQTGGHWHRRSADLPSVILVIFGFFTALIGCAWILYSVYEVITAIIKAIC